MVEVEGRGLDDVRERSPLHELGGDRDMFETGEQTRDMFRVRVRRSGSLAKGPLIGRHPTKTRITPKACSPGPSGIGTTISSPSNSRKNSEAGLEKSPVTGRKHSTPGQSPLLNGPQRPSRLPVVAVYNPGSKGGMVSSPQQQPKHTHGSTGHRKVTPPSSGEHDQKTTPTNKYMRRNSMSPGGGPNLVIKRGMSPTPVGGSKRSASPSRGGKRTGSPRRGEVSRRVSSPVYATRRRSPSLTRSRPPSPGGGFRGSRPPSPRGSTGPLKRNPSPSQLDPEQAEALRKRLGRARKVKLYLLQKTGSNSFLVAGESPNQKYKVNIGPQTCSCGKGPGCLHLLFIMLRVFKIPENDSRLTARELKEFEIEALFRSHEDRNKTRVLRSRQQSMENLDSDQNDKSDQLKEAPGNDIEEDANCPICLTEMSYDEELTSCSGCHNQLHHPCMAIWTEECQTQGDPVVCPLCRGTWIPTNKPHNNTTGPPIEHLKQQQNSNYQYFAPAPYLAPGTPKQRAVQSPGNSVSNSSGYSTISRTSDTVHMIEQGGCPEDIPLPKAEPIPQQHWLYASTWITHFGRDLVACLFSRDWVKRETGLRRLAREIVKILQTSTNVASNQQPNQCGVGVSDLYSERVEKSWRCCADMLTMMIEDKVYKVYLAAVKTLRALLQFLSCEGEAHLNTIRTQIRPIVQSILVKCADGNRRISEVSTDALFELCRGQAGEMGLGKHALCSVPSGLGGLDYMLQIVLEERELHSVSWQWIMGRLVLLERIIQQLPEDFSLENKQAHTNFNRLMMIIDFSYQNLSSNHANVSKLSRKVFVLAARNTASDNTIFNQVWELMGTLDPTLQIRMRKRLALAIEEADLGAGNHSNSSSVSSEAPRTPQEQDRTAFLESFLNECSNQHTEYSQHHIPSSTLQKKKGWRPPLMRSTSHSPSRQMATSRSNSQSPSRAFGTQQLKKSLCQSVFNVNQITGSKPRVITQNKPRVLNRLATKSKIQDLAAEVLPKFDLSFLMESTSRDEPASSQDSISSIEFQQSRQPTMEAADIKRNTIKKSKSMSKVAGHLQQTGSRNSSPVKATVNHYMPVVRSPPPQKKRSPGLSSREGSTVHSRQITPMSSPLLGQRDRSGHGDKQIRQGGGSCKDNVDFEESLALAMALSKSIYLETPLPVIPGLSSQKPNQDVLAHPHRNMLEDDHHQREYREGIDWTKGMVLGTGAFSTCYQARDVETGTLMAAKQISFCRNSDEEQDKVEQLIREEVLLISKLQHPHVVRMYGAIQEEAHINVFVEWMPGGSISSLLDKHGAFTESVSLRYIHQILLGLEYLHSNGILHRDLKGANLLVDTSGHHLRIADFGAAARMMSKSTVPGEFRGQLTGTIAFMAPEVLRGDSYGRMCDIWSVGCCIIEMATGKPPWGASDVSNHLALIFRIACANEPPEVPENLSPALRDLTRRCLELDPALRPTARELLLHPVFHQLQQ